MLLGTGPSLSAADVSSVRGRARVIAVNGAVDLAPWADVLYSSDQMFWLSRNGMPTFAGLKYGIAERKLRSFSFRGYPDIQILNNTGPLGLETDPRGLRHGKNSGFAAINLAVHLGAARVLLLGYNLGPVAKRLHFDGTPGRGANYDRFARAFPTLVEPLKRLGVEVLNCTSPTRLTCFPSASLPDVLSRSAVAA